MVGTVYYKITADQKSLIFTFANILLSKRMKSFGSLHTTYYYTRMHYIICV